MPAGLSDDTFHAPQGVLVGLPCILVVIDRKFYKQHVQRTVAEHVPLQAEGAGVRAGGADPGVGKREFCLGKPLFQHLAHQGPIAVHLGDRAAQKGHMPPPVPFELDPAVTVVATQEEIPVADDFFRGDLSLLGRLPSHQRSRGAPMLT